MATMDEIINNTEPGKRIDSVINILDGRESLLGALDYEIFKAMEAGHLPVLKAEVEAYFSDSNVLQLAQESEDEHLRLEAEQFSQIVRGLCNGSGN